VSYITLNPRGSLDVREIPIILLPKFRGVEAKYLSVKIQKRVLVFANIRTYPVYPLRMILLFFGVGKSNRICVIVYFYSKEIDDCELREHIKDI